MVMVLTSYIEYSIIQRHFSSTNFYWLICLIHIWLSGVFLAILWYIFMRIVLIRVCIVLILEIVFRLLKLILIVQIIIISHWLVILLLLLMHWLLLLLLLLLLLQSLLTNTFFIVMQVILAFERVLIICGYAITARFLTHLIKQKSYE